MKLTIDYFCMYVISVTHVGISFMVFNLYMLLSALLLFPRCREKRLLFNRNRAAALSDLTDTLEVDLASLTDRQTDTLTTKHPLNISQTSPLASHFDPKPPL